MCCSLFLVLLRQSFAYDYTQAYPSSGSNREPADRLGYRRRRQGRLARVRSLLSFGGKDIMRKSHPVRLGIFKIMVGVSVLLLYCATVSTPDPAYGRVFAFLISGLFLLLIWVPYNITCMFLDGNKGMGISSILIAAVPLAAVAYGTRDRDFGFQTLALCLCTCSLGGIWLLSVINFFLRRKNAEPSAGGNAAAPRSSA